MCKDLQIQMNDMHEQMNVCEQSWKNTTKQLDLLRDQKQNQQEVSLMVEIVMSAGIKSDGVKL